MTMTSHELHAVSNHRQFNLSFSLFRLTRNKPKLHFTAPLWGYQWLMDSSHKGSEMRKRFKSRHHDGANFADGISNYIFIWMDMVSCQLQLYWNIFYGFHWWYVNNITNGFAPWGNEPFSVRWQIKYFRPADIARPQWLIWLIFSVLSEFLAIALQYVWINIYSFVALTSWFYVDFICWFCLLYSHSIWWFDFLFLNDGCCIIVSLFK